MNTKEAMLKRWQQLESRDRKALSLLGIMGGVLIIIYGLVLPIIQNYQDSKSEFKEARELIAWMQANQSVAKTLTPKNDKSTNTDSVPLLQVATETAKKSGLTLDRLQPEGDSKLRVWFTDVKYEIAAQWLLDISNHARFEQASIERGDKPGFVNLNCLLIKESV